MVDRVALQLSESQMIHVLEPSVGDGSFISALTKAQPLMQRKKIEVFAVEQDALEIKKAEALTAGAPANFEFNFFNQDFLQFDDEHTRRYQLVVGNPPYIKKTLLSEADIANCLQIHGAAGFDATTVKNIWSAFLIKSCQQLTEDGVIAFVLPSDLLQVKFSNHLRHFLIAGFERVEVFTFDDLMFECKGQDTVLLFAYKKHSSPGQFYSHIADVEQLSAKRFTLSSNRALKENDVKWSHHHLTADELNFLHSAARKLKTINDYCDSKPGIVTAANEFFIVDEKVIARYDLAKYAEPIIQKGFYVNGSVEFNEKDLETLCNTGRPAKLLRFTDQDLEFSEPVQAYLALGEGRGLPDRYKCKKRTNWFVVPNVSTPAHGFFFKRSHKYPKLLKNSAQVHVTDSGYKISMREGFHIDNLVCSFYNSLTLAFAELKGRYYGGGVLELTPSEFKGLPIPYAEIGDLSFQQYCERFEAKSSIADILRVNDKRLLADTLDMSDEDIAFLNSIYNKLLGKRLRTKMHA